MCTYRSHPLSLSLWASDRRISEDLWVSDFIKKSFHKHSSLSVVIVEGRRVDEIFSQGMDGRMLVIVSVCLYVSVSLKEIPVTLALISLNLGSHLQFTLYLSRKFYSFLSSTIFPTPMWTNWYYTTSSCSN